jgi:taurine--2-oxoglutarate transaminase
MAGLGRTGEWFACDNWNVVPDIITMAKGLTSAYLPLGCVALSSRIAHAFDEKPFPGGLTYNGHPMCLAAAVATLKVFFFSFFIFFEFF